jgi:ATP-dependent helicase YprA (DUF1998 family)
VVTSATIANPLEHAALLLGLGPDQLLLVDEDGSPHGPKDFVLWNPPLTAEAQQVGLCNMLSGSGKAMHCAPDVQGHKDVVLWNPLLTAEAQQVGMYSV